MPAFFPIQPAFNGGEISGRMRGRVDLEQYKRSCSYMENWEPFAQGSMRLRPGTKFRQALASGDSITTDSVRVFMLRTAKSGNFPVIVYKQKLYLYSEQGLQLQVGAGAGEAAVELVVNGDFSNGGAGWEANGLGFGAVLFQSGSAVLFAGSWIRRAFTGVPDGDYALTFDVVGDQNIVLIVDVGSTLGGHELAQYSTFSPGRHTVTFTAASTPNVFLRFNSTQGDGSAQYPNVVLDNVSILLQSGGGYTPTAPWADSEMAEVQVAYDTAKDRAIFVHPAHEPMVLARGATGAWTFDTVTNTYSWVGKPASWTGTNWPSVVDVFQGRLWLGAPPDALTTFWGSKSGDLFNFTIGSNPGDAFSYIAATKSGFQWMKGQRTMFAGADAAELSITAASVVVGPGDVEIREESAYGSAPVQAIAVGDMVAYVSGDRRKIRALIYDRGTEGWESTDLTLMAEHLTEGGIAELHFGRDPNETVVALLRTGQMAMWTFNRREKVLAGWRWTTNGRVLSAAVAHSESGSVLWMIVHRGPYLLLETYEFGETYNTQYCDAYLDQVVPSAGWDAPGFPADVAYRAATLVGGVVLTGGWMEPDGTYTSNSEVTEEMVGQQFIKGIPYRAKATPLPLEGGNPGGSLAGFKVHRTDLSVRLNRSAMPLLNGKRPSAQRSLTTPMDAQEPLFTGDVTVKNLGVVEGGVIDIEQDLPLRTEVCALYGNVQASKV